MQLFSTKLVTEMPSTVQEKAGKRARSYQTSKIETQRVNIGFGGRENRHRKVIRLGQSGPSLENLAGIVDSILRLRIDVIQGSL